VDEQPSGTDTSVASNVAVAYMTLLRARGCPRWLWKLSTSDAIVTVAGIEYDARWDETTAIPVPPDGANIRMEYLMSSRTTWNQKVTGELKPGDSVTFRASWWPWFTRPLVR
jgi:hypothetical protein